MLCPRKCVLVVINAKFIGYPDVGIRTILPLLKESFAAFPKQPSQNIKAARSQAAEDRRLANILPSEKEDTNIQLGVAKEDAEKRENEPTAITHAYLWPRLSSFFKKGDVIVGETGTAEFGILDTTLPKDVSLLLQGKLLPCCTSISSWVETLTSLPSSMGVHWVECTRGAWRGARCS